MSFRHVRGERLVLLDRLGDHELERLVADFRAVWRLGRHLKTVAGFDHAVGLAFDRKLSAASETIGGFNAGMGVARHNDAGIDFDRNQGSYVFSIRQVGLGQDGALEARHLRIRLADCHRPEPHRGTQGAGGEFSSRRSLPDFFDREEA